MVNDMLAQLLGGGGPPSMQQQPDHSAVMQALLGQAGEPPDGQDGEGQGESQQESYQLGDLPRKLIDLTHQAIQMEPNAKDKNLLGRILSMLLQWQQDQIAQGQSK